MFSDETYKFYLPHIVLMLIYVILLNVNFVFCYEAYDC